MSYTKNMDERVLALAEYAESKPEGYTYQDIERELGWPRSQLFCVNRQLRLMFGSDDTINLVCEPQGQNEPWLYRLVGTLDDARIWSANRLADTVSRLETQQAVAGSIVRATDGRTTDGRKARVIEKVLGRLLEDIAEMEAPPPIG